MRPQLHSASWLHFCGTPWDRWPTQAMPGFLLSRNCNIINGLNLSQKSKNNLLSKNACWIPWVTTVLGSFIQMQDMLFIKIAALSEKWVFSTLRKIKHFHKVRCWQQCEASHKPQPRSRPGRFSLIWYTTDGLGQMAMVGALQSMPIWLWSMQTLARAHVWGFMWSSADAWVLQRP